MRMRLNNWELKQEYLVNLRNQFGLENGSMHQIFKEIYTATNERRNTEVNEMANRLSDVYARIEENYKLGNSFY
jgi:response regulator RpfG family c-di-GMP phosphodiesterase